MNLSQFLQRTVLQCIDHKNDVTIYPKTNVMIYPNIIVTIYFKFNVMICTKNIVTIYHKTIKNNVTIYPRNTVTIYPKVQCCNLSQELLQLILRAMFQFLLRTMLQLTLRTILQFILRMLLQFILKNLVKNHNHFILGKLLQSVPHVMKYM